MQPLFQRIFKKKFKKLPLKIQLKFSERLGLFIQNPFDPALNNHSVDHSYPGCRSINITGDYRAVYYKNGGVDIFVNIGTHTDLY